MTPATTQPPRNPYVVSVIDADLETQINAQRVPINKQAIEIRDQVARIRLLEATNLRLNQLIENKDRVISNLSKDRDDLARRVVILGSEIENLNRRFMTRANANDSRADLQTQSRDGLMDRVFILSKANTQLIQENKDLASINTELNKIYQEIANQNASIYSANQLLRGIGRQQTSRILEQNARIAELESVLAKNP